MSFDEVMMISPIVSSNRKCMYMHVSTKSNPLLPQPAASLLAAR
jgi:hypothetical protein